MSQNVEVGDSISIKYNETVYKDGGRTEKEVTREDTGVVVATPSEKFSWLGGEFDFDYEMQSGKAVRSVNLDEKVVAQLMYNAGGDREWEEWSLQKVDF